MCPRSRVPTNSYCVISNYVWVCVCSYFEALMCIFVDTHVPMTSCAHELVLRDQQLCMSMRMFIFLGAHVYIFRCSCAHDFVCPRTRTAWSAHMYDVTLSYVWHDLIMCVTWLVALLHMAHDMTQMWHWRIHMWHDSFICDIDAFVCDMIHSYVTWLIHMWHDSFICDMTHSHVMWLIHMSRDSFIRDITHPNVTWLLDRAHTIT